MSTDCMGALWGFLRKFFSLIVGLVMGFFTVVYCVGAGRVITLEKNFFRYGFAHFLGILFSCIVVIFYIALHFIPRKAYRLLYFISFILVITMLLVSHSLGLAAPHVTDCYMFKVLNKSDFLPKWKGFGTIGILFNNNTNKTETLGTHGNLTNYCQEQETTFVGALMVLILYIVALFDVQNVLLKRVKSKTYGERFVEMGITN